jgi:NAD dependent epimerase/dehydratase family enzyme
MDNRKIVVLAGASGFIGGHFRTRFKQDGWQVRTIGRAARTDTGEDTARWGDDAGLTRVLDGADLLVNLAGRSVNCRYSQRNKAEILNSRVSTTAELGHAIGRCSAPPATWLNASTGTIYRHAEDAPQSEHDGELGEGFSVDVARAWESALASSGTQLTRRIPLRISIVLGPGAGVMRPLANLARLGLGAGAVWLGILVTHVSWR